MIVAFQIPPGAWLLLVIGALLLLASHVRRTL